MTLPSTYTNAIGALKDFFNKIKDAQAPDRFTQQMLKDLGYKSKNHRAYIPLMKALGFLSADGIPTKRYNDYRNHSLSKKVMGEAIKDTYSDIFLIKSNPTTSDKKLIEGKFKSYHNASDNVAALMTKTFYALLSLADINFNGQHKQEEEKKQDDQEEVPVDVSLNGSNGMPKLPTVGLHYNIQIQLPATKDLEVYNAIFKSLKEHLIE